MHDETGHDADPAREATRDRIVEAAARLVADGGREALTTRAIAAAAGVQAPAIYRLFGDKDGLVDALVLHGFEAYLDEKAVREPSPDPVEGLRRGWDLHVAFGLANPGLYVLMYGERRAGRALPALQAAWAILAEHVAAVAAAGRLRVPEQRAAGLIHAAGSGTVLSLLAVDADRRDPGLSTVAREAVISAVTIDAAAVDAPGPAAAAIALRVRLGETNALTPSERELLGEWLQRIAAAD